MSGTAACACHAPLAPRPEGVATNCTRCVIAGRDKGRRGQEVVVQLEGGQLSIRQRGAPGYILEARECVCSGKHNACFGQLWFEFHRRKPRSNRTVGIRRVGPAARRPEASPLAVFLSTPSAAEQSPRLCKRAAFRSLARSLYALLGLFAVPADVIPNRLCLPQTWFIGCTAGCG